MPPPPVERTVDAARPSEWSRPRLMRLALASTDNTGAHNNPDTWEGGSSDPSNTGHYTGGYRMPTSSERNSPDHAPSNFPF